MIYLDTSVALAALLHESERPPDELWQEALISSRLLEYELWVRLNAKGLYRSHGKAAQQLLHRVSMLELRPDVLQRALEPFKPAVRTLDALHLASAHFLEQRGIELSIASYDKTLCHAAKALGMKLWRRPPR